MRKICLLFCLFATSLSFSQDEPGSEIGADGYFSASSFGGTFGIGAKYGYRINEAFIFGPSVRVQRTWQTYYDQRNGYTIYGGGVWAHARIANYLFAGVEFEMLNSPLNYTSIYTGRKWVPTFFLGGGFSRQFNNAIRINAGIFYDVVNNLDSPFRQGYFMHKSNGALIPVIYRIGFFFPLS